MSKSEFGALVGIIDQYNSLSQPKIEMVANQAEMLSLNADVGFIVIRADDNNYQYRLNTLPANNLSNWQVLGKDAQPIGETVADVVTTNEVITSKANGLYAFNGISNGGLPNGISQGDIAQKTGSAWTIAYTFESAPATIYSISDGQTYDKKINSSGQNSWVQKPKPAIYEIGADREFTSINTVFTKFINDGIPVGAGVVYDSVVNEKIVFASNAQNFLLQGYGTTTRNNSQISSFEVLGHRFTLKNVQAFANTGVQARTISTTSGSKTINITGAGQTTAGFLKYQKITGTGIPAFSYIETIINSTSFTINQNATATGTNVAATIQPKAPIVIDCSGTITENGVPNTPRGKHVFDGVSFSNPSGDSAVDIFNCGSFIEFKDCDFGNKSINLYSTSPSLSVTILRCNNGFVNTYSPNVIVIKAYSPSVYSSILNLPSLFADFDKATPVAYSLLRQYSALGLALPVPLGSMLIHDDVGGNLQMLKCKTAYTIAAAPGVGTGVDLTKYDIQTDASKQNIARRTKVFANQATNFTISQADIDNFESFEFNQTTTGIVISLSTPTGSIKKDIYFKNIGTTSINLLNTTNPIGEGKMTIASYNLTSWNVLSGDGGGDGGGGAGNALPYFYGFKILPDSSLSFEKSLLSDLTVLDVNEFDDYFISTLNLNYSIETGDLILSQGV